MVAPTGKSPDAAFKAPASVPAPGAAASGGQKVAPGSSPAGANSPNIRPGVRKSTEKPAQRFGMQAFGADAASRVQPPDAKRASASVNASAGNASKPEPAKDEKVSFSAERKYPAEGIAPRRAALPGGRNTLSHFDGLPPPEVSMRYRMQNGTAARVLVNPQDQNSPIYAPVRPGGNVEGAGVYLDMDVAKNLQFQFGGEVRDFDDGPGDVPGEAAGASMGFKLNF